MVDPARPLDPPDADPPEAGPLQAYTLPTARRVVASGLSLALESTGELRRASIYIGLLVLGAFGPAIIAFLLILGRLGDGAGDMLATMLLGTEFGGPGVSPGISPALEAALLIVLLEALLGLLLFVSISIDAQVIAIAILGGRAAGRPMRLWESIIRARQTFWRMAASGTLVGFVTLIVQSLLIAAIDGFSRSPEASSVAGALLATIIIAPLAYVSTSVVLGDVGAMEALSRSWRLYKARKMLAVVVVLFTFVTSAIHLFAFSAGIDLVARAAEILNVSVTEGLLEFLIAVVLILAVVVAYGSLMFTIGAIVSAPQVTGFLGLTFYSAGLDRARVDVPRPPRGFRYVGRPMVVALIALAGLVTLQVPAINSIPQVAPSAALTLLRDMAGAESDRIEIYGYPDRVPDPAGDTAGEGAATRPDLDILEGEAVHLSEVPDWVLAAFDCGAPGVACGGGVGTAFDEGALLFAHLAGAAPTLDPRWRIAVLLALESEVRIGAGAGGPFAGASRMFVASLEPEPSVRALRTSGTELQSLTTAARSTWRGELHYTLVPWQELPFSPTNWDIVTIDSFGPGSGSTVDSLRTSPGGPLPTWEFATVEFVDLR
jgi:hypothetical protein